MTCVCDTVCVRVHRSGLPHFVILLGFGNADYRTGYEICVCICMYVCMYVCVRARARVCVRVYRKGLPHFVILSRFWCVPSMCVCVYVYILYIYVHNYIKTHI
jgi:hypothetical protein